MFTINRLIVSVIFLLGWTIFLAFDRGFFFNKISAMPGESKVDFNTSTPTIRRDLGTSDSFEHNNLQNQVRSQLYNSISSGMSYEEVSSIIGWKGVLIYETEIDNGGIIVRSQVYQWNYDDVYSSNISTNFPRARILDPYQNLTLEFQNNILVDRPFSDSKP